MNSLERVLAALRNQPSDRPALFLNASLYGARLTGAPLAEHYTRADIYAEGQMAVRETFSPDLLISPFFVSSIGEAFGSPWRALQGQAPNVMRFPVGSAEEMLKLPLPDVDSHPRLLYLRETIRRLSTHYAGEVPIFGVLVSPADIPPLVIGLEAWIDALLFQPGVAQALMNRLAPFFVDLAKAMLGDGATGLVLTCNLGNAFLVTNSVAETLTLPNLKAVLEEVPGPVIFHHGGCPLLDQLVSFKGLPQVVGYVVDIAEDLGAARGLLGPGPILLGNLDGPGLLHLAPEDAQGLCRRALGQRGGDNQIIISTCGADIQIDTPPETIAAISEVLRQAGGASS
ncbi:MAG: UroD-like decarboxylase/methyltransferase [Holophagaceae bacterium]|nr:UroD-like decarboxylase/methyltransferase [Holophagaceae bacterium]